MSHVKSILKSWYDMFDDTVSVFLVFILVLLSNFLVTIFIYYWLLNLPEYLCLILWTATSIYFPKIINFFSDLDMDRKIKDWIYSQK